MSYVKRISALGAAAVLAAVSLTTSPVQAAEHEWKMATSWGGGPLMDIGAKAFAEKIKFLTDGRIEVDPIHFTTLYHTQSSLPSSAGSTASGSISASGL